LKDHGPVSEFSIGVDTGGTFTDLVFYDRTTGQRSIHKLPTTPDDPARGILEGIAALLGEAESSPGAVEELVHGTTLATNAILQRRYAKTGMLTTTGFRDVLEIGRQRRPSFYNLDVSKPKPPATRDCIYEIDGRLEETGGEVTPLDEDAVRQSAEKLKQNEVAAIAICFLHAYANPDHEARAKTIVNEIWPEAYVCTSAEVLREFREFERFASTAVNASLLPVIDHYLERLRTELKSEGLRASPLVMQSNGGAVSVATVRKVPINTFFSGPAGGVIAAANLGKEANVPNLISFDMGGTSTDVSLIRDGKPAKRGLIEMAGFPVRVPALDIHTIGAGGGSIAWVDPGGLLKVGPHSAGADPGPALYGRGGTDATVTDANVVLGRLSGGSLIGGAMTVFPDRSTEVIAAIGERAGLDPIATAAGILEIVNVNMMGAVRVVSIERGEDPRNYALAAFGGAGPLHAADVAREIGIRHVIAPPRPGLLSAMGLLDADRRGDFSVTRLVTAIAENLPVLREGAEVLTARGKAWRQGEALGIDGLVAEWGMDIRYLGQAFEITLPLENGALDAAGLAQIVAEFHHRHQSLNGYVMPDQPVEIVTLRLGLAAIRERSEAIEALPATTPVEAAIETQREVWFPEAGFVKTPIYDRLRLAPGHRLAGPAVIEQSDSTTIVPPLAQSEVDSGGNLHIELDAGI
jgi:N-methylhydantoinase A